MFGGFFSISFSDIEEKIENENSKFCLQRLLKDWFNMMCTEKYPALNLIV